MLGSPSEPARLESKSALSAAEGLLLALSLAATLAAFLLFRHGRRLKARLQECLQNNGDLERHQQSEEQERQQLQEHLARMTGRAAMADTATGVLHNLGNVLNSVNTSLALARDHLAALPADALRKSCDLLEQNHQDLPGFLTSHAKGQKLPVFLQEIAKRLCATEAGLQEEMARLNEKVEAMREVISAQQRYASHHEHLEELDLQQLVEDALVLNATSIGRHEIKVVRLFRPLPSIMANKAELLQILINLYQNAKDAMAAAQLEERVLRIELSQDDTGVLLQVTDNGMGIPAGQLTRLFEFGYTTKARGHGFGLHSSARFMEKMGGCIWASSPGEGCGATFSLWFPSASQEDGLADPEMPDQTHR
jgi:signal transduction histidine kinase